jgi:hypothetical protein
MLKTILTCTGCGTHEPDYIHPMDQGYSACCNEPVDRDTVETEA